MFLKLHLAYTSIFTLEFSWTRTFGFSAFFGERIMVPKRMTTNTFKIFSIIKQGYEGEGRTHTFMLTTVILFVGFFQGRNGHKHSMRVQGVPAQTELMRRDLLTVSTSFVSPCDYDILFVKYNL